MISCIQLRRVPNSNLSNNVSLRLQTRIQDSSGKMKFAEKKKSDLQEMKYMNIKIEVSLFPPTTGLNLKIEGGLEMRVCLSAKSVTIAQL